MAVPRPVLLAMVGALLAATAFFATRGARESDDTGSASPSSQSVQAGSPSKGAKQPSKGEPVTPAKQSQTQSGSPSRSQGQSSSQGNKSSSAPGLPPAVERALQQRRVIVLFFNQPGAADDDATAEAVSSLKGGRNLAIFRDHIKDVGKYSQIVAGVGVSQAPSIVIVGRDRRARLVEGYVDAETLAQHVADVR